MTDLVLPGFEPACAPVLRPRYELAITEHMARAGVSTSRSWDAYGDVFGPAFDDVRDDGNECIGLVCAFVEYVNGEPLEPTERKRVARGVRMYGKAMLHALNEALSRTDEDLDATLRYATVVATGTVRRHRRGGN